MRRLNKSTFILKIRLKMVQMVQPNDFAERTRFLFIRHGQTEHNIRKILQGHLDIPLNPTGHLQAEKLGEEYGGFPFDKVYSSDLTRCRETVGKMVEKMDEKKSVQFTDQLRERHMGEVQGMHIDDAIAFGEKMGKHYRNFGESNAVFSERLDKMIKELEQDAKDHKYKNVAIISHGGTIRAVLRSVGVKDAGIVFNTSITVIDFYPETGKWEVQVVGDTAHLGQQVNIIDQRVQ